MRPDPAVGPVALQRAAAQLRAAKALTLMRSGLTATAAVKKVGTTMKTLHRYGSGVMARESSGRYTAARGDRLTRRIRMLTPLGIVGIDAPTSRSASRIAQYWTAVHHYLKTGDESRLQPFRGKAVRVRGQPYPFVIDPPTLDRLAHAGEVRFEDLYELPA